MPNISVSVKGDAEFNKRSANLKRYAIQIVNAPAPLVFRQEALQRALSVAKDKYSYPPKPKYPLRWKSRRQQIAVIIKLKNEGNLPYQRTNELANSWGYEVKGKSAIISNDAKDNTGTFYAPFVIAKFQQPFHADTGWRKRSAPVEKAIIKPILEDVKKRALQLLEQSKNA